MSDALLKLEKRRFTNAIRDDPNGNLFSPINSSELQYAGLPSPQIDKNWNDLIDGKSQLQCMCLSNYFLPVAL